MTFESNIRRPVCITFIIALVYATILVVKDFLGFPGLYQDENHYLPTAVLFSREIAPSLNLLKTYNQLNTPLPFILGGWVIRLLGEDVQHLRLMNFLLSFCVLLLFVWYKPGQQGKRWQYLVPLVAMPSFYLCAVHYYTDMTAWLSVLLGVVAYLRQKHFFACMAFAAAIASRQYMLAFPLAIGLFEVLRIWEAGKWEIRSLTGRLLSDRSWIWYVAAVLSLAPWILLWGGPAPEAIMNEQHYGEAPFYNPGFVIYTAAIAAFYFVIPEAILGRKWGYFTTYPFRYPRTFTAIAVGVTLLLVLFPARQTHNEYFTWPFLGYLDQLLETAGIGGWAKQGIFGILTALTVMRFTEPPRITLSGLFVLTNILLLGKAQLSWDKYLFPTLMVLWFLAIHREERTLRISRGGNQSNSP